MVEWGLYGKDGEGGIIGTVVATDGEGNRTEGGNPSLKKCISANLRTFFLLYVNT